VSRGLYIKTYMFRRPRNGMGAMFSIQMYKEQRGMYRLLCKQLFQVCSPSTCHQVKGRSCRYQEGYSMSCSPVSTINYRCCRKKQNSNTFATDVTCKQLSKPNMRCTFPHRKNTWDQLQCTELSHRLNQSDQEY
jgi:hypothetical protein